MPTIARRERWSLAIQRRASHLALPLVAVWALIWIRAVKRLTLREPGAVRARFAALLAAERGPVLICANHLTLVDSIVMAWALAPVRSYLRHYARFPWSLPDKTNFSRTPFWRLATYFGKGLYVPRGGPPAEVRRTLDRIAWLLRAGDLVLIFPEGGRSRTGRVDTANFAYGVGRILQAVPETRVLGVYLRGRRQEGFSDFPLTGDEYEVRLETFHPATPFHGLRGARDLATQIVHALARMEAGYRADRE